MRTLIYVLAAQLVVCGAVRAQVNSSLLTDREEAAIHDTVRTVMDKQQLAGVAVGVLRNGRVVFTRGYGYSNLAAKTPLTNKSVINWASNSKPVMAILALQLAEQGLLDLDADIRKYVPEFPEKSAIITTRQLLCHQSGLPHYSNGAVVATPGKRSIKDELDPIVAIRRFDRSPLIFEPGTKMEYSSHAYVLLSAVVQRASGQPIHDLLQQKIVEPLKLTSFQLDLPTEARPEWATGYVRNRQNEVVPAPEESHAWKHGAGGYKSDIDDFALWAQALLNRQLLSAEMQQHMWTSQKTANGERTTYGLGMVVEGNAVRVSHNGSQQETKTRLVLYPEQHDGMVIMSNCSHADPTAISTAIYKALAAAR